MARTTSDRWKAAVARQATGEQPVDLLTFTHPDLSSWHVKICNDNDWFARRTSHEVASLGTLWTIDGGTGLYKIHLTGTGSSTFFTPASPIDEYMSALAFIYIEGTSGDNDGPWQIHTIGVGDDALVTSRKDPVTASETATLTYMETFRPLNFAVTKPVERADEVPTVNLTVGFNDPALIDQLAAFSSPPRVKAETVLKSEPETTQWSFGPVDWLVVNFDRHSVSGTISGPSALNAEVPRDSKTPYLRPGLYNLV